MRTRCGNCGAVLQPEEIDVGARFCSSCGASLAQPARAAPVQQPVSQQPAFEAVSFDLSSVRFAGFFERLVAWIIDGVLLGVASIIISIALDFSAEAQALTWLGGAAYYIFGNGLGGTLGKLAIGLRVIDANGDPPGFARGLVRYIVSIFSVLVLFLGDLWMIWEPQKRTWQDLAAGTYVIRL